MKAGMSRPLVAILYAPGTNCHEETAAALAAAGLESRLVLFGDWLAGAARLQDFQAAVIPGGFSYGDHLGAGRIFGSVLTARMGEAFREFVLSGKPVLGICNGFQVLAEAGILPDAPDMPRHGAGGRAMALLGNQSARFEDRWVRLKAAKTDSLWIQGLNGGILAMPSAHGEGRALFTESLPNSAAKTAEAFLYCSPDGSRAEEYPENPSGSPGAVAGVTDAHGLVLGLMPHPERASLPAHASQDGLRLFKNLAAFLV